MRTVLTCAHSCREPPSGDADFRTARVSCRLSNASAFPSSSGGDSKRRDEVLPDTQTAGVAAFALTGSVVVQ